MKDIRDWFDGIIINQSFYVTFVLNPFLCPSVCAWLFCLKSCVRLSNVSRWPEIPFDLINGLFYSFWFNRIVLWWQCWPFQTHPRLCTHKNEHHWTAHWVTSARVYFIFPCFSNWRPKKKRTTFFNTMKTLNKQTYIVRKLKSKAGWHQIFP